MPGRGNPWKEGGAVDSTITTADVKDSSIQAEDLSVFKSTEVTETGAAQNIAHGLGRVPALVWWSISLQGTGDTVVETPADSTNVILDFPATTKLFVYAL